MRHFGPDGTCSKSEKEGSDHLLRIICLSTAMSIDTFGCRCTCHGHPHPKCDR
jgi:hypothetical protein